VAGLVADLWSWHWVFLGVVVLALAALLMVLPALRGLTGAESSGPTPPWALGRLGWAALAAVAVLGLDLIGDVPTAGPLMAAAGVVIALIAVRRLVPAGTLRARRGLATTILVRGIVAAGIFAAQIYPPYLLTGRYAFPPSLAGRALAGGAVAWALASLVQGKLGLALPSERAVRSGALFVLTGVSAVLVTSVFALSPLVAVSAWVLAGAGMG